MKKKKILVLLASFNGNKYIKSQIDSIFNQKNTTINLLISDDGSTDNTIQIVKTLKKKYKKIKIIKNLKYKTNPAGNFYNLFENSNPKKYDFIALSDQDDIFNSNKFFLSTNILIKKNFDCISSPVKTFGAHKHILKQSKKISKYDFCFEGAGQGCTFVMKSSFFSNFRNFFLRNKNIISNFYYHDWLIYIYCRASKNKWFFFDKVLTLYRIHNTNLTGSKNTLKGNLERIKKILNGWYFDQVFLANKISLRIDKSLINFKNINFINFFLLSLKQGRRKVSDRLIASIFIILLKIFNKLDN